MKTFEFTLELEPTTGLSGQIEDSLFEAGCDDALLSFRIGMAYLDFDREAENLERAVFSAIQQVEKSELKLYVKRVESSDLVTSAEIAQIFNRRQQQN